MRGSNAAQPGRGGAGLRDAQVIRAVEDLAVEVRQRHAIVVDDREASDAGRGERRDRPGPEPAAADDDDAGRAQPALQRARVAELGEVRELAREPLGVDAVERRCRARHGQHAGAVERVQLVAQRRATDGKRGKDLVLGDAGGEQVEQAAIDGVGVADDEVVLAGTHQEQRAVLERERLDRGAQGITPPARGACGRGRRCD